MTMDDFDTIEAQTEPKDGWICDTGNYGLFYQGKLLVHKRSRAPQINKNRKVCELMLPKYEKMLGVKLEVREIPLMYREPVAG